MRWFMTIIFACFTYLILIYFYGKSGVYSFENLKDYHGELEKYVSFLEEKESFLEEELASLYFSELDLALQSRKIGYFQKDEEVFTFSLPLEEKNNLREIPTPLQWKSSYLFSNSFFYIASIFSGFFLFISWGFLSKIKDEVKKIRYIIPLFFKKIKPVLERVKKDFPIKIKNKKDK